MIAVDRYQLIGNARHDEAALLTNLAETVNDSSSKGLPVDLGELMAAYPETHECPVLLDAAIEYTLDSRCSADTHIGSATELLVDEYPSLAAQIRRAGCLSLVFNNLSLEPAASEALEVGQQIGPILSDGKPRYEIQGQCGDGSSAKVYRAIDRRMSDSWHSSLVALKVTSSIESDPLLLHSEGVLASIAGHPNVVNVIDRGSISEDLQYVAMELSSLGSLQQISIGNATLYVRLIRDVALGLHAAHSAGVVHGDIKPDNILLFGTADDTERLVPKLSDFGTAKSLRLGRSTTPSTGSSELQAGNLAFMAPEIWAGSRPTIQSDVYSLAAMLQYLLTEELDLRKPQHKDRRNSRYGMPNSRLASIIDEATKPDPACRTASAIDFANRLTSWLNRTPIPGLDSRVQTTQLYCIRHPVIMIAVLSTLLVLGGGAIGGAYAWQGWVYESARRNASASVSSWHERYSPAFSDRSSVYDLASRYALAQSTNSTDAFDWATTIAPDLRTEIAQHKSIFNTLPEGSMDRILLREQLVFRQLQSRVQYPDTAQLIETQQRALAEAGLLTSEEREQLNIFRAVYAVKCAVINKTEIKELENQGVDAHISILSEFLAARGLFSATGLSEASSRDPRTRLAARAAHWLSSPKLMDIEELHNTLDIEYSNK